MLYLTQNSLFLLIWNLLGSGRGGATPSALPCGSAGYQLENITSYEGCFVDPINSSQTFAILSFSNGFLLEEVDGMPVFAASNDTQGSFHFSKPPGSFTDQFDLVYDRPGENPLYLAVSTKVGNEIVFVESSLVLGPQHSKRTTPSKNEDCDFITSIWSIHCNGTISTGIVGGPELEFSIDNNNTLTILTPEECQNPSQVRRQALGPFLLGILPTALGPNWPSIDQPRCTISDTVVRRRAGAEDRPPNGCGSDSAGILGLWGFPPDFDWGHCCNVHDQCYDDCSQTWVACNQQMLDCTQQQCRDDFGSSLVPGSDEVLFGCLNLAYVYNVAVSSIAGRNAFDAATQDQCECVCPDATLPDACPDIGCVNLNSDPENCGLCGWGCGEGKYCVNGECQSTPTTPSTPYFWTFDAPEQLYVINSISSQDYFLLVDGSTMLNTKCLTIVETGVELNLKTIPAQSPIVYETEPDVFPQACCIKYFANSDCQEIAGQFKELCTSTGNIFVEDGVFRTEIDINSWFVYNCQGEWTGLA
ncbi:hypothetical protein K458DRAFT_490379 [Lentithecium fluviatile CBS 122367]|uniref:Carbohydrate-binding module family 18 protein n=1 Tax=Lentithecium fluviatile CBS 122367 TaxID=1168545 RepID=A0A6G1IP19_9PLEO|nr:hypothetical protein K458DRAFT_490379 [Lentithecium fluviatile CBS 122367]